MRRNTTEAYVSLTFIGSNGVSYEATWAVTRAYKEVTGSIKGKTWELKNLETEVTLTKDAEIKNEIRAAVGLDFNQFCRTTMLAQGEFTRFLNSKDDEKAEILEKITGVDVYSKIGAKVYEQTDKKKKEWEDAKRIVEGTRTLSDEEIADKQEALSVLDNQYKEIKAESDKDVTKRDWLQKDTELTKSKDDASVALRIANEAVQSEDFKQKEQIVKDWNATIDARLWMTEVKKAKRSMAEKELSLVNLKSELNRVIGNANLDEQEARIKQLETDASAFHLPDLRKEFTEAKVKLVKVAGTKNLIATLKKETESREAKRLELRQQRVVLEAKRKESEEMAAPLRQAQTTMNQYKEALEKPKDTVHNFAKTLRLRLHKGDICPVCRQEIMHELPLEHEIAAIIKPLEDAYAQAEKTSNDLHNKKVKLDAEILAEDVALSKETQAFEKNNTVEYLRNKALQACLTFGINDINENTAIQLENIEQQIQLTIKALETNIKEGEGFGTLSGEPLQKAVETLRSLHTKAGRHVGIISHVEELQERIPVQIQVNQEGNNSSSKVKIVPEIHG